MINISYIIVVVPWLNQQTASLNYKMVQCWPVVLPATGSRTEDQNSLWIIRVSTDGNLGSQGVSLSANPLGSPVQNCPVLAGAVVPKWQPLHPVGASLPRPQGRLIGLPGSPPGIRSGGRSHRQVPSPYMADPPSFSHPKRAYQQLEPWLSHLLMLGSGGGHPLCTGGTLLRVCFTACLRHVCRWYTHTASNRAFWIRPWAVVLPVVAD